MNLDVTPRAKLVGLQEGNDASFTNCGGKERIQKRLCFSVNQLKKKNRYFIIGCLRINVS